jgi:hypothetical protein
MFSFAAHNLFGTSSSICEASLELFGIAGFLRQLREDSLILPGMKSGGSQRSIAPSRTVNGFTGLAG